MNKTMNISEFPTEIIVKILSQLGFQDRQNVALVNKFFYSCCREKALLADTVVCISVEEMGYVNKSLRFDHLRALNLSNQCLTEYTEDLSQLSQRLVELDLCNCEVSRGFLSDLLSEIAKETKLRKLNLRSTRIIINLSMDKPSLQFGEALAKLEEANFWSSSVLDLQQIRDAFQTFQTMGSLGNLRILNLGNIDTLRWVEPGVFGKLLNKLEVLNIRNSRVTIPQFQCLVNEMEKGTNLKVLKMGDNGIDEEDFLDINQLSVALNRVSELELWPSEFSLELMLAIMSRFGQEESKVKKVLLDEGIDWAMAIIYPEAYPEMRRKFSQQISFTVLIY